MEVQVGASRFTPVPDQLEPLVRAYARLQGRSVTRAPSGVLEVSDPPAGSCSAAALVPAGPEILTGPQPLIRTQDGAWLSPRARDLLNTNSRE